MFYLSQLLEDSIEDKFEKHGALVSDLEKVDGENKETDGEDKVRNNPRNNNL